ncbi:unnamed protein product [Spirodela intermedia]|uniref:CCHC-type domain-containing protein n=1 Tax=Spirodela intermedia TaxID=51605 RepID=A0A7I8JMQ5_SPIIN|nr:unnamed protein product [Spirodela intermedia]CAA6671424.1 unnamed protein product [Spirodela intermedia]
MQSFRVDKRARTDESGSVDGDWVPLYDRGFTLGLSATDGSARPERVEPLEASRCFNCGSYSHSLKDCPRPRDSAAINLARRQHSSRRNSASGQRGQTRYYQISTGKFDGLRAGVLGPELRESLGIGELDPPPWLHRMRELGYPPGYLGFSRESTRRSRRRRTGGSGRCRGVSRPDLGDGPRCRGSSPIRDGRGTTETAADLQAPPRAVAPVPIGYSSYDHHSLSRTPRSLSERERGPLSYEGSPYSSGHSLYSGEIYGRTAHSDRWYGGAAAEDSPPRRDRLRHRHHHHHHQR